MKKSLPSVVITIIVLLTIVALPPLVVAQAASEPVILFAEGWEKWSVKCESKEDVMSYKIICPERNSTLEALQEFTLEIMSYCKEKKPTPSSVEIRFPYKTANFSEDSSMLLRAFGFDAGIRAITNSFLNISSIAIQQGNAPEIIVVLDINNPDTNGIFAAGIPMGEALEAAKKIADDIKAKSSDSREQIVMLNDYLIRHVGYDYAYDGNNVRSTSSLGALIDGKAICSGYTNAVNDICYLLDIPSYQLNDPLNRHIWNVVNIASKWLMVDATWNDSSGDSHKFLLLENFSDDKHSYLETKPPMLARYAERLRQGECAADKLRDASIIKGDENGDFALAEALTYEALAVVLTRLDEAERYVSDNTVRLSSIGADRGYASWAAPFIGYCIERQYYVDSFIAGANMSVSIEGTQQILLDYFSKAYPNKFSDLRGEIYSDEWTTNGTILLRGAFFRMLESCI
jgi:Uncharacterized protein involved in cytokinesis, contains TGc (transglutaminase/protease-like) domain